MRYPLVTELSGLRVVIQIIPNARLDGWDCFCINGNDLRAKHTLRRHANAAQEVLYSAAHLALEYVGINYGPHSQDVLFIVGYAEGYRAFEAAGKPIPDLPGELQNFFLSFRLVALPAVELRYLMPNVLLGQPASYTIFARLVPRDRPMEGIQSVGKNMTIIYQSSSATRWPANKTLRLYPIDDDRLEGFGPSPTALIQRQFVARNLELEKQGRYIPEIMLGLDGSDII